MPARTGKDYLAGLREQRREIYLGGQRVEDVTAFPGLANGARSVAALYVMQHDPALRDEMTYTSPTTGQVVGGFRRNERKADALAGGGRCVGHLVPKRRVMLHIVEGRNGTRSIGQTGKRSDVLDSLAPQVDLAALLPQSRKVVFSCACWHSSDLLDPSHITRLARWLRASRPKLGAGPFIQGIDSDTLSLERKAGSADLR